jgi:hypothetical protein
MTKNILNKKRSQIDKILTGVAGEYYVAAELSKRNYIASITLRNTKGIDILCSNPQNSKTVGIQVKTNKGSTRSWILNKKVEDYFADNLFYIFVNLNDNIKYPDFFIVPSKTVAKYCKENHKKWLQELGRKGNIHRDNPVRKFDDTEGKYLNRWDLIEELMK